MPPSGSGIELQYPLRLAWPSPWLGHIPFAAWLVEAVRPHLVVELGVHSGNSYCAFLQAIQALALPAQCYGIDHWRGDKHSDQYDENVYAELCSYHDPLYGTFSTLMRTNFEDAVPYFADGSIDLLHIDGFHTYDAVAKDFSDWLPKMSQHGVVLLHDINVREREFGVWRFWEEVAARYDTFAFVHSHGLGVAYVGSEPASASLRTLLDDPDTDTISHVRSYFGRLGMSLVDRFARQRAEDAAARGQASEAALEAARDQLRQQSESAETCRTRADTAAAQVAKLEDELAVSRTELARREDAASTMQAQTQQATERLALLEAELEARRVETDGVRADLVETKAELADQTKAASISQADAHEARDRLTSLQSELDARRAKIEDLTADLVNTKSALACRMEADSIEQADRQKATDRMALLESDLDRQRAANDTMTKHVSTLEGELFGARTQVSDATRQRDNASGLLRKQMTATMRLQRESADMSQRLDNLAKEHAAAVRRAGEISVASDETREQLHQTQDELNRVHASVVDTLTQPRYILADRLNSLARKLKLVHGPLKRFCVAWYRTRRRRD